MTNPNDQTIVEHLTEFRRRLIWVVLCFILTFVISCFFAGDLYVFITGSFEQKLLVLGPNDILWIYISLASLMAIAVTLPFCAYQLWAFIRPALKEGEGRGFLIYVPAIFLCFVAGLAFGFFLVTPALLNILLSLGEGLFETQLTAENYLTFVLHTTVPIAIIFEFPVIIAFLTSLSLISPQFLVKYRRYAYFVLLFVAVILTPADFVSDLAMTVPLVLLYEAGIVISKFIYHKKEKRK